MFGYKFIQNITSRVSQIPVVSFVLTFTAYVFLRTRQVYVFGTVIVEAVMQGFNTLKSMIVRRMFWGRGSLYKSSFHFVVVIITAALVLTGLLGRIGLAQGKQESLSIAYGIVGNEDLIQQGGSLISVQPIDVTEINYKVSKHIVASGETLQKIAEQYGVSKDTIKWANDRILSPFNDNVNTGWELLIPEMNGVLYTVKAKDTLDKVISLTNGNKFDIIELNNLVPPSYNLTPGQKIFIPDGAIKPPPPPPPKPGTIHNPGSGGYLGSGFSGGALGSLPEGTFDDPLTNPACAGYVLSRGFSPWHDGADLARGGGCPIRAIAAGRVIFTGWNSYGGGYVVRIDHGGGVESQYLHGDGNIWVKTGDYVFKGQDIMYMGSTGNSTGTHLHLTLKYNGVEIDPAPYVPYRR